MKSDDSILIFFYILAFAIVFLICAVIVRAIFNIPTIVKHLKTQTDILERIAIKQGVSADDIDGIKNKNS